jgi:hypothetical protein
MMASRSSSLNGKPKTTMRNIEIENDQTVAITLSDDAPVHTLVPIIAKQVKNDITPLTDADRDASSPIVMLDHYLSLGAHQLPFDASLLLKDSSGSRTDNRYATLGTFVLVFARLPTMCDRVAVRKGVSKKRLWLELSGMYLRCYKDTSPAAMDEMSTLRKFAQQAAGDLRADVEDSIDKVEYLDGSQLDDDLDDNGASELDEIARVEKEMAASRAKAAAAAAPSSSDQDRGELVGQMHVSHIEFVSTDVKNSKSFKIMFRRPPLPSQQPAPLATSASDLSYTFVCDDVEVKLDWYELLNDWLPFFQSYRDADGFLQTRDNSRAMHGLLGEDIYTAEELAAGNQKGASADASAAATEDYGASGRKPITRTAAPLAAARSAPSPEAPPRAAAVPTRAPIVVAMQPTAAASAPAITLPPRPAPAPVAKGQSHVLPSRVATTASPPSPVVRRPSAPVAVAARGPPPQLAAAQTPPRSVVTSNYVTVDPGPDPSLLTSAPPASAPPPVISPRPGTSPPASQPPMPPAQHQAAPQPIVPARRGPQVAPARVGGGAPSPKLPPLRVAPVAASPPPQRGATQYETVPEMPATPTNRSAYRVGKPKFNRPPGDGTHDDPQRQERFRAMVKLHLTKYAWYTPTLTRQTAEAKLKGAPEKSFVVRDSSVPHCLALSHVSGGKVVHVVLEFWDCDEVRGWTKEDGKTISASVAQLLSTFDFVDLAPYTVK